MEMRKNNFYELYGDYKVNTPYDNFRANLTPEAFIILKELQKGKNDKEIEKENNNITRQDILDFIVKAKRYGIKLDKERQPGVREQFEQYVIKIKTGQISKEKLRNEILQILQLKKKLGDTFSDEIVMARIFTFLGQNARAMGIFKGIKEYRNLRQKEELILELAEKECLIQQWRNDIYKACAREIDKDTIINESLRKVPRDNPNLITTRFIIDCIDEFKKLKEEATQER